MSIVQKKLSKSFNAFFDSEKSDETKFMRLTQSADAKRKERDELQSEGKRILGHPARS